MDKIEKMRQEIERLQQFNRSMADNAINSNMRNFYDGSEDCCRQLLSFLDTLSKEPDKSLEDAAREYCKTIFHKPFSENPQEEHIVYEPDKYAGFIAGAKWQAEQDDRDVVFWKGMQHAIEGMKKEAIPCKVMWHDGLFLDYTQEQQDDVLEKIGVNVGDKVKLIILKDNGKSD